MIIIRFPTPEADKRALGYLTGRFSFKSWATGEMIVPEAALPELAMEGIPFSVEGPRNMSNKFRRFEILLPLQFNDGQPVPEDLVAETMSEIRDRFGAVSAEKQSIQGLWQNQGRTYRDELTRIFVDVPDGPGNVEFFRQFKQTLKDRFQQIDIWMTSYPVDVI